MPERGAAPQAQTPSEAIAACRERLVRVLAGPGTGKSYAIRARITRLLREGVDPRRILAVSFTNMSAGDLRKEIASLEVAGADRVQARTLHAHCYGILGRNDVIESTGRFPRPLAKFELEPLLHDLEMDRKFGDKRARRARLQAYEAAWARDQQDEPDRGDDVDREFEAELQAWLVFHRAMLLGELVPQAYRYLRRNPGCAETEQFDHVLVDEYQDLNKAEQEVARAIAGEGSLVVVGDDDQSIYRFKHAHPEGIIQFATGPHGDHALAECYRCPRLVVSMANSLIAVNRRRAQPPRRLSPRPANGDGEVGVIRFASLDAEASYIASYVLDLHENHGTALDQIIVLCPTRHLARPIFDALENCHVPVELCFAEHELDEEDDAAYRMSCLALAANSHDRVSLRHALGAGSSTFLSRQYKIVRAEAEMASLELWDVLEQATTGNRMLKRCGQILERFQEIRERASTLSVLRGSDLIAAWLGDDDGAYRSLRALALQAVEEDADIDAQGLHAHMSGAVSDREAPDATGAVRIMSLHKSKGLSCHAVIIAGILEGACPRKPPADETDVQGWLEEQRRLFYVGMTRVKAAPDVGQPGRLLLTHSAVVPTSTAKRSGLRGTGSRRGWRATASQFLSELGPDCPEVEFRQ